MILGWLETFDEAWPSSQQSPTTSTFWCHLPYKHSEALYSLQCHYFHQKYIGNTTIPQNCRNVYKFRYHNINSWYCRYSWECFPYYNKDIFWWSMLFCLMYALWECFPCHRKDIFVIDADLLNVWAYYAYYHLV